MAAVQSADPEFVLTAGLSAEHCSDAKIQKLQSRKYTFNTTTASTTVTNNNNNDSSNSNNNNDHKQALKRENFF